MKKLLFVIFLSAFSISQSQIKSQDSYVTQCLDSINIILKANPYFEDFDDVTFYYSVDITDNKELVVEMTFDGPFKWLYKANIDELDLTPKNDVCLESTYSLCWMCKQKEPEKHNSCVKTEMILTDGYSDKQNASNICVSFSNKTMICNDLYKRFQQLFNYYNP